MNEGLNENTVASNKNQNGSNSNEEFLWPLSDKEKELKNLKENLTMELRSLSDSMRSPISGGFYSADKETGEFSLDGTMTRESINYYPEKVEFLRGKLKHISDLLDDIERAAE